MGVKSIWHMLKMGYFVNSAAQPKHTENVPRALHLAVTCVQAACQYSLRPQPAVVGHEGVFEAEILSQQDPRQPAFLGYALQGDRPSNLVITRRIMPCQMSPQSPSTFWAQAGRWTETKR